MRKGRRREGEREKRKEGRGKREEVAFNKVLVTKRHFPSVKGPEEGGTNSMIFLKISLFAQR